MYATENVHAAQTRLKKVSVSAPEACRQLQATEGATVPRIGEFIKQLRTAQGVDPFCVQQRAKLVEEPQVGRQCRITAGLVWHIAEGRYQLVTPAQPAMLRDTTLRECHDAACSGYLGVHKTLAKVRTRFWWPGMADEV